MTSIKTLTTRLEALDDDFMVFSSKSSPPTKAKIDAVEKELGVALRADHRALLAKLGSCAILVNEKVWPRAVQYEVRPAWQFSFGIEVFGVAPETAPGLDVVVQTSQRKASVKKRLVAAMRRIGERRCIGYDAKGALFTWAPGGDVEPAEESSLFDVLMGWLRTLEEDKEKIKQDPPKTAVQTKSKSAAEEEPTKEKTGKATTKSADCWLAELLDDSGEQREVGAALMKESPELRKKVIDLIIEAVEEDEDETDPLWGLAFIDEDERAIDALIAFSTSVKKPSGEARKTAIGILGALDVKPARAGLVLVQALGDSDEGIVAEAAEALQHYADSSAIPALKKALAKEQTNPRWVYGVTAGHLFRALGSAACGGGADDHAEVVRILTENLAPAESRYAALPAFRTLIAMNDKARDAIPKLEEAATGKDPYLATLARHALGAITGDYKRHLTALETAAKSEDSAAQSVAEGALRDAEMAAIKAM